MVTINDIDITAMNTSTIIPTDNSIGCLGYAMINGEMDIFSDLPRNVFIGNDEMALTMNLFRDKYYEKISNDSLVMPKLKYSEEGNERLIRLSFPWSGGNANIYLSFDKNNKQNFFGYSSNDIVNNEFTSKTIDINKSNRLTIVDKIISLIQEIC